MIRRLVGVLSVASAVGVFASACGSSDATSAPVTPTAGASGASGHGGSGAGHAGAGGSAKVAGAAGSVAGASAGGSGGKAGSAGSSAGAGGTSAGKAGSGGAGPCTKDSDCTGALPDTNPPKCAAFECQMDGTCLVASVDADGDGYRAAKCQSLTDGVTVKVGSDCNDTDADTNPKAWDGPAGDGHPDRCDLVDQNCDGTADDEMLADGTSCTCTPGATSPCDTDGSGKDLNVPPNPPAGSICKHGSQKCLPNGTLAACVGAVGPSGPDDCTTPGDDLDCNGVPNEGCECVGSAQQACGACMGGLQTCENGKWGGCSGAPPNVGLPCNVKGNPLGACANGGIWTCDPSAPTAPTCVPLDPAIGAADVDQGGSPTPKTPAPNKSWDWNCDGQDTLNSTVVGLGTPSYDLCGATLAAWCASLGGFQNDFYCSGDITTGSGVTLYDSGLNNCGVGTCTPMTCDFDAQEGCGQQLSRVLCTYDAKTDTCNVAAGSAYHVALQTCN